MKGFSLKKAVSARVLFALGAGAALWISAFLISGPVASSEALGRGLKAFGMLLGISAAALAFRAAAWKIALSAFGYKNMPLASILVAAVSVGGTPVKLALLKKKTGIADGAGSIAADRSVASLAVLLFAGAGLFCGFLFTPGNIVVRGLMLIFAVGGLGFVVAVTRGRGWKAEGFFTSILKGLRGLARRLLSPAVRGRFEERDRFLSAYRRNNLGAFRVSLLIHLTVLGLGALEIFVVGRAIDPYFPAPLSLALAAAIPVFRAAFFFVPASFGFLEAAVAGVVGLTFGAPLIPVGVAIVILLRLRTLAWWGIGLAAAGNPAKILFGR